MLWRPDAPAQAPPAMLGVALLLLEVAEASLLTSAILRHREVPFRDCMRRAARRDEALQEVLQRASPGCRSGLQDFYCRRVAAVPGIRRSPPMARHCAPEGGPLPVAAEASPVRSRVVFFVLAAGYEGNLLRLIRRLQALAHHILVHIDTKRPEYFARAAQALHGVAAVDVVSKLRVNRGGVSTLNAWLFGISWLLSNAGEWDYYINLNDSDYPIASLATLSSFLWLNHGANFVNVGSAFKDCDCGRFLVYECGDELYSIAPETQYPRRPELHHASGPNLVAVSRALADYINATQSTPGEPVQQILEDLGILQQPDEKFFQTVMLNSPFCRAHVRWSFHIWDRPGLKADDKSPEVAGPELKMLTPPLLSDAFLPRLVEVKERRLAVFFARKFDNNRTAAMQDAIDAAGDSADSAGSWHALGGVADLWARALLSALLGPGAEVAGTAVLRREREGALGGGPPVVAPTRLRARVRAPCASSSSPESAAQRARRCAGLVALEELGWRMAAALGAAPQASGLPLIGAIRIGAGWSPERMDFNGAVAAIPEAQAGGITAVIYWSHAWVAQREGTAEQELEVVWLEASGRRVRGRDGIVATNTMVSWLAPAAALLPAPGEWSIEVRMGGVLVGTRPFYICSAACEGISAQAAQRYFRAAAPARGQAAERGASRT